MLGLRHGVDDNTPGAGSSDAFRACATQPSPSALMNAVTRGLEDWQLDFGTICLRAFPQLQKPRYTDIAHARTDQAYRYWTLARDEEPVICLSIDAIVIDASNGY